MMDGKKRKIKTAQTEQTALRGSKRQKLVNGKSSNHKKAPHSKLVRALGPKDGGAVPVSSKKAGKERLKNAVTKWERLRRHDTSPEEKSELVQGVLKQVEGRVIQTATSPTGSRVLQACIKHSTPEQRSQLLRQILPHILDLSKQPYGHFLVRRLVSLADKEDQKAVLTAIKGHVPMLLRHPCGAAMVDELYTLLTAQQRNHLAAEFYGREFTLLSQEAPPSHLSELLETVDPAKRRLILQRMAMHLTPIMEKALVDPVLTHRLIAEYIEASGPAARTDAFDSLTGEALLRMVHTRNGAWVASAVLCHGTAKHCKAFLKAIKGHVGTMARDRWGSLVLASALCHVDDTVLLRKCILPELQEKAAELMADKYARLVYLQLLAPDKARYLQTELLEIVNPSMPASKASGDAAKTTGLKEEEGKSSSGSRLKDPDVRRKEVLGTGGKSFGACLLREANENLREWIVSPSAGDCIVELTLGGKDGVLYEAFEEEVEQLQASVVGVLNVDPNEEDLLVASHIGSRCLRRLILESQGSDRGEGFARKLCRAFKARKAASKGHHKKVQDALKQVGLA